MVSSLDDGSNLVEWDDLNQNETGFVVSRATGENFGVDDNVTVLATTGPNVTGYTDPSAVSGTTYYYRIQPMNDFVSRGVTPTISNAVSSAGKTPTIKVLYPNGQWRNPNAPRTAKPVIPSDAAVHVLIDASELGSSPTSKFNTLTDRFTWDFGDPSTGADDKWKDAYNIIHGFNAAHVYSNTSASDQTHTITLTIEHPTTDAGSGNYIVQPSIQYAKVVVSPESLREKVYISNTPGVIGTQSTKTLDEALQYLHAKDNGGNYLHHQNVEFLFARGQTFTFSTADANTDNHDPSHNVGGYVDIGDSSNLLFGSYTFSAGATDKPVLLFTSFEADHREETEDIDPAAIQNGKYPLNWTTDKVKSLEDYNAFQPNGNSHNIVFQDLVFTSPYRSFRNIDWTGTDYLRDNSHNPITMAVSDAPSITGQSGSNILLNRLEYGTYNHQTNATTSIMGGNNHAGNVSGFMVAANLAIASLDSYMIYSGGRGYAPTGIFAIGNTATNSLLQSIVRIEPAATFVNLNQNNLRTINKSALRLESSSLGWAERNTLSGSGNWVGPLPGADGSNEDRSESIVIDSNMFPSHPGPVGDDGNALFINPGLQHAVIRNNIFKGTARLRTDETPMSTEANNDPKTGEYRDANDIADDVWVVNNTRLDAAAGAFLQIVDKLKGTHPDRYIRVKHLHFVNNFDGVTSTNSSRYLDSNKKTVDGVSLQALTAGNPPPLWAFNIKPSSAASRWWIADNFWRYDQSFVVDDKSLGLNSWNKNYVGSFADTYDSHPPRDASGSPTTTGVLVSTSTATAPLYTPLKQLVEVGLRDIVGAVPLQVAAWDYYGHLRPVAKVSAGAVDRRPGDLFA